MRTSNACLWCDADAGQDRLCPACRAINDHPPFHCPRGLGHLPTLGDACAECAYLEAQAARRAAANAPAVESLLSILRAHVRDLRVRWPGCEHGKAIVGNSILGALRELGCPEESIRSALSVGDVRPSALP